MRAKGFVLRREGSRLIIEMKPKTYKKKVVKVTPEGKKVVEESLIRMWDETKKYPKEGAIVRIIWHDKDSED